MTPTELDAIRVRDAEAPDYGPTVGHDPARTSHALINAFRDRRALLAALEESDATLRRIFDHFGPPQEATDDDRECECFMCDLQRERATDSAPEGRKGKK